jgi:hypothetical protein
MRQIGYRQEAGRLGAIGSCGRELCCSTWLTDFKIVSNHAARYQNLSLNPLKLNGQCGKLKCCLNFELESYMEAIKEFPQENYVTLTFAENKIYKSVKTDILKRIMWFSPQTEIGGEWLSFPVSQVIAYQEQNKRGEFPVLELQEKKSLKPEKVELEFKNDMGIGSLTRLDEKDRRKNANNRHKNKSRQHQNQGNAPKPQQQKPTNPQNGEGSGNRNHRRPNPNNRPNRNPNQTKPNNQNPN